MHWPTYRASLVVKSGGVIAYPTETVWGIGCDPFHGGALQRVIDVKRRDAHKGLILVGSSIEQFDFLLEGMSENHLQILRDTWPGPFTYLVPHHDKVHPLVHGQFSTVAIRVSPHPGVQALCDYVGSPIVSTSANYSGCPTVRSEVQARKVLGHEVDFVLSGPTGLAPGPSRIVDLMTGRVIRK